MNALQKIVLVCISLFGITTPMLPCATCLTKLSQKDKPFFIRYLSMQKTNTKEMARNKHEKQDMKQSIKTAMK